MRTTPLPASMPASHIHCAGVGTSRGPTRSWPSSILSRSASPSRPVRGSLAMAGLCRCKRGPRPPLGVRSPGSWRPAEASGQ
eukprot:1438287-Lingulodinium_polyedra.AAC.1